MQFDPKYYPYPSTRYSVYGKRGMLATSQPLATEAGMSVFRQGGNAIDAALAAAAALTVVDPASNGPGGDLFAIVWTPKEGLQGLNCSGQSIRSISWEQMCRKTEGRGIPNTGWLPVTVPGAPAGWRELSHRYGQLPLTQLMKPAIELAREGHAASVSMSKQHFAAYSKRFEEGKESWASGWFQNFCPEGSDHDTGKILCYPYLADTLEDIAQTDSQTLYHGRLGRKIVEFAEKTGGQITSEDLVSFQPEWVTPISINYRGYDVCEIPPNGQGLTALIALNILKNFSFDSHDDVYTVHRQLEAMKLAFADAKRFISDPRFMDVSCESLLTEQYGYERSRLIGDRSQVYMHGHPERGGTVYLCAADGQGNMISLIQSLYMGYGSGVTPEGTGMSMQCRGHNFVLEEGHPNCYAPSKRPYHTIIPGFLMKDGQPVGPFGVMGGFMQPQGHVQVIMNSIDFAMNPQTALDAPRWCWDQEREIHMEPSWDQRLMQTLTAKGHDIHAASAQSYSYGRGQIIWRTQDGTLVGGTEPRTDAGISAW